MAAELLSDEEVRAQLRVPQGHDEPLISLLVSAATSYLEKRLEEPIIDRSFSVSACAPGTSTSALVFRQRRVQPDTVVVKYWTLAAAGGHVAPDGEVPNDALRVEEHPPRYPMVWPTDEWPDRYSGTGVVVEGTAGIDANDIPANWKQAALQLAAYLYDHPSEMGRIREPTVVDILLNEDLKYA